MIWSVFGHGELFPSVSLAAVLTSARADAQCCNYVKHVRTSIYVVLFI